ncbi:phenylalanine--tRNA ligase subunit alpha [Candidatus Micrarchaeota archaeon CG10_big_fil_rev_8_21_14_0_10_45_29]|nr:MAG: phenylalanine--tRNA ligase subunit alpha [Candidatus Micrarchaeota archaeon CG10_big_fil_rev_8_21_14_0_10_45_29]
MKFSPDEAKLLAFLLARAGESSVLEAAQDNSLEIKNADSIRIAAQRLAQAGLLETENSISTEVKYTREGQEFSAAGLPEVRLLKALAEKSPLPISTIEGAARRFGIPAAKKAGWIEIKSGSLLLTPKGKNDFEKKNYPALPEEEGALASLSPEILQSLERRGIITTSTGVLDTALQLSAKGKKEALAIPKSSSSGEIGALSRQTLLSGSWKGKTFRKYGIGGDFPSTPAARRHPISRLREKICQIFSQMGFEQMEGPLIESAFWNFDALFQPQDHPARDLADTFYIDAPSPLPNPALVKKVAEAHKGGWGYEWESSAAQESVLRTHTTAVSARTLHDLQKDPAPKKFFSIGKVFRNEATDYKHLAEFFQVEGIISWEGAQFPHLLGTLKAFYQKLGFEKIRFRPSFFPYTEPSLEIEVFHPARKEWIELGGAGILRPEVTLPLCSKYPVLAWGLSLERPLMLSGKISDIRTLYRNDLSWLRDFSAKQ